MRRHTFALVALLVALFVAVRLPALDADPPSAMPNRGDQRELLQEPPAKAHEARDYALFGSFAPSAADGYAYWRAQSPAWVLPLGLTFRVFGVSYVVLRAFAIAGSTLGFLALLALARERLTTAGLVAAALFFGFNYYWIQYSRYGLLEPNVDAFLTVAALCVHRARRRVGWLVPATAAFGLALLTKQTALFALPALLVAAAFAFARSRGEGAGRRALPLVVFGVCAAGFAAYASTPAYARTLGRNLAHAALNHEGGPVELGAISAGGALDRLLSADRWGIFYLAIFTIAGVMALVQLVRVIAAALARRADPWDALVAGWAASAFAVLVASPLAQNRFFLILFPPVTLLAGRLVDAMVRGVRAPLVRVALPAILCVNHLVLSASPYLDWLERPGHGVARARVRIEHAIGRADATVIGLLAAPVVFESPYRQYYVKSEFNATREALIVLHPTHALLLRDGCATSHILNTEFPGLLRALEPVDVVRFEGAALEVYALPDLGSLRDKRARQPRN